jgi:hypothetical protein
MLTHYLSAAALVRDVPGVWETLRPRRARARLRRSARELRLFRRFCRAYGLQAVPAEPATVLRFITALHRYYRAKSILTMLQVLVEAHRESGYPSPRRMPLVRATIAGWIKEDARTHSPPGYTLAELRQICAPLTGEDPQTRRDQAILTVAFWGQLGAAEITALDLGTLERYADHWRFHGVGTWRRRTITLDRAREAAVCPVTALERWLRVAGITDGKVFRQVSCWTCPSAATGICRNTAVETLKRCTRSLPEDLKRPFSALRTGMLEAAFHAGVPLATLAERGGYGKDIDLRRRLHAIVTPQPGDPPLPPAGRRAPSGRRAKRRPQRR